MFSATVTFIYSLLWIDLLFKVGEFSCDYIFSLNQVSFLKVLKQDEFPEKLYPLYDGKYFIYRYLLNSLYF